MRNGTLLYAQSGGVTAVINATAAAVIEQARAKGIKVLAARNGILGALREELIDTSKESAAAIRALAMWPDAAAAQDLLAVYRGASDETQQVVAFRGYVRVCRMQPEAERVKMLVAGLQAAKRPAEKKEALGALGDMRDIRALQAVVPCMDSEAVKEEAAGAVVRLSRQLCERYPGPVKAALEKALQVSKNEHVQREGKEALERAERKLKEGRKN